MRRREPTARAGRAWWCASSAAGAIRRTCARAGLRRRGLRPRRTDGLGAPAAGRAGDRRRARPGVRRLGSARSRARRRARARPLQRIQIVKGWLEGEAAHERVYDVAGDAGQGGASVDLEHLRDLRSGQRPRQRCAPSGAIRTSDAAQPAFYYARVIENPTCRWSQKLCIARRRALRRSRPRSPQASSPAAPEAHRPVIQERAWSSPIWYQPEAP